MLKSLLTVFLGSTFFAVAADGVAFFESEVRPILEKHCLKCHSETEKVKGGLLLDRKAGWQEGGDSGPVIVPGKPEESLLVRMVRQESDVEAMPPKSKLSDSEIGSLVRWIEMGVPDPRDEAIGAEIRKSDFDLAERLDWWSLQPVRPVEVPEVEDSSWPRTELDRFILAKLEERNWSPAEEADAVTLLRRASLVLTGLAPTPAELTKFLQDQDEGAFERAVDRLLASPHFGEHWARHWMDVVRYGESKAFEQDYWMTYAWRYRDYLIRAFNDDVPYDQFVREALAGDVLDPPRRDPETGLNESLAGPGFLHLADGHHGVTDLHEDEARVMDSIINVVGTAFHGLTIACARCHDHKFDAITDDDYYSLYGIFRSSRLHYANAAEALWSAEKDRELTASHEQAVEALREQAVPSGENLKEVVGTVETLASDPGRVEAWKKLDAKDQKGRQALRSALAAEVGAEAARWFESLYVDRVRPELAGLNDRLDGKPVSDGPSEKLPERDWIIDGVGFEKAGDGVFVVDPNAPTVIRQGVGSGLVAGHRSARLDGTVRSQDFTVDGSPVKIWVRGRGATVSLVIRNYELVGHGPTTAPLRKAVDFDEWRLLQFPTNLWKGEIAFLQVQHHGAVKRVRPPRAGEPGVSDEAWVAVATQVPDWTSVWTRKKDPARIIADLLAGPEDGAETEVLGALFSTGLLSAPAGQEPVASTLAKLKTIREAVPRPVFVRTMAEGTPRDEPVYIRGNHQRPSDEPNPRHFLDGFGGEVLAGPGTGRRAWAEHLLSPDNPLTARVRVNRIWARIFGRGLVASVNDFGKMGEKPSHPELLDYLAADFVKEGWSIKTMIRKMVLSSTFRMSSVPGEEAASRDPKNTLLQHMPVRRMSAEAIRDHILAASGELRRDLYGPSILAYIKDQPPSRARPGDGPLDGNGRRSLYLASRRNYLPSFLRAFDAPNASEPVGQRNVTNVPAQSLALMNDPMVHEMARRWALKIQKDDLSLEEKIKRVHQQAFSRKATGEDLAWSRRALEKLGLDRDPQEAWQAFCHLMINRKEFIYVF